MTTKLQNKKKNKILILGGAGLVGSEISKILIKKGFVIRIIDNLDPLCFGSYDRIKEKLKKKNFYKKDLLKINIKKHLIWSDIIINCIGWTRHSLARNNRSFNEKTNYKTVSIILKNLKNLQLKKLFIHLGTLSQFNNASKKKITDKTSFNSTDSIGIMKSKAEKLIIQKSKKYKLNVVCIRLGNCFSDELPLKKNDPGLLATLLNDLLTKKKTIVYGRNRIRNIAYIPDIAKFIELLIRKKINGYVPINFVGRMIVIEKLLQKIINKLKFGKIIYEETPRQVKMFDTSFKHIESKNFYKYAKKKFQTPIDKSLAQILRKIKTN